MAITIRSGITIMDPLWPDVEAVDDETPAFKSKKVTSNKGKDVDNKSKGLVTELETR